MSGFIYNIFDTLLSLIVFILSEGVTSTIIIGLALLQAFALSRKEKSDTIFIYKYGISILLLVIYASIMLKYFVSEEQIKQLIQK